MKFNIFHDIILTIVSSGMYWCFFNLRLILSSINLNELYVKYTILVNAAVFFFENFASEMCAVNFEFYNLQFLFSHPKKYKKIQKNYLSESMHFCAGVAMLLFLKIVKNKINWEPYFV